ncbi:MAG TPA: cytochrome c nitrite reductase small subunit [Fimbriimonas sp.]
MRLLDIILMRGLTPGWRLLGMALLGALVGMFGYVVTISNAPSYMSDDPKACINCHIMEPVYATWQHSSHAKVTVCNDCHVPQDNALRKYFFKANDGLRHSALFTLRMERQVIQAIPESKAVIQENCIRCHEPVVSMAKSLVHSDTARPCIDCHREVPHGRIHSLSATPNAPVPKLAPVLPDWMLEEDKK